MEELLLLKDKLDILYNKVVDGNQSVLDELDNLLLVLLKYDDLSKYNRDEVEQIISLINAFTEKVNLIYELLEVKRDDLLSLENLREDFSKLEMKRFVIVNNYVMGMVTVDDIDSFRDSLFQFRNRLYAIPISDNNILEIAKMKSKVQHFNTEVLEDEEVLKQAYANKN